MKKELLIYAAAFVLMTTIAFPTFADTISQNQSGVGNVQNNGGTLNSPGANSPHATATSISGSTSHASSTSSSKSSAHQAQGQVQFSEGGSADNALALNQNYQRNPVSSAISAPLVAADDTCMGSSSVGGQGVGFGLSVGSTWHDGDCVRRKDARELHNMGQKAAALALMCQNEAVAAAMQAAGTACPSAKPAPSADLAPAAGTADLTSDTRWPSTRNR
jgi:hypothetical protein